jgi:hypothetical protein
MSAPDYMAQVEKNANEEWVGAAADIVARLAAAKKTFTTDDVWEELAKLDVRTHEPRAMGAVMSAAKRMKMVSSTSTYVISTRPECHSRPIRVWESLVI